MHAFILEIIKNAMGNYHQLAYTNAFIQIISTCQYH